MFSNPPTPPYVAVIFSSQASGADAQGYAAMAQRMGALAAEQPGYLAHESARGADGFGITVSYWRDDAAAQAWKRVAEHLEAQRLGRERWYSAYAVHVARVERAYVRHGARGGAPGEAST